MTLTGRRKKLAINMASTLNGYFQLSSHSDHIKLLVHYLHFMDTKIEVKNSVIRLRSHYINDEANM